MCECDEYDECANGPTRRHRRSDRFPLYGVKTVGVSGQHHEGPNSSITYRSAVLQDKTPLVRFVTLVNSAGLNFTMLEYTTPDETESKALQAWLSVHGYKRTPNVVNGTEMIFFESKTA